MKEVSNENPLSLEGHISGTSKKSGKPYDLTIVHTLMPARGVEGSSAKQIMLDYAQYPADRIAVGVDYDLEFDNTGYPISFHPAK